MRLFVPWPPQSQCTCKLGFAGDGYECSPIDPCRVGNGGCHSLVSGYKGSRLLGRACCNGSCLSDLSTEILLKWLLLCSVIG